jgi:hypothetical protein
MDYRPTFNSGKAPTAESRGQKPMNMNLLGFVKMRISSKSKANKNE